MTPVWLARCRSAARFCGGVVVLIVGLAGALAGLLLASAVISP